MYIDYMPALQEWNKTVSHLKEGTPIPHGRKLIKEWISIDDNQEDFDKGIQYLKLWKYFQTKGYDIIDESLIFRPAMVTPGLYQQPTLALKIYIKLLV